jgi:hypothetical protein
MVTEHIFGSDPDAAEAFLKQIEGAEKDPIKDTNS